MYELISAGPRSWYLDCPAKIGMIRGDDGRIWLVDAGGDKDAGKRVKKVLDEQGWTLAGILATHSHADHIGGCRYLQQQYNCPVYAPGVEGALCEATLLEPALIYGGFPPAELRHKFLLAQPCRALPLTAPGFPGEVEPLPLPGHYLDMVGYRSPDGVVFLADCLASEVTLMKYQVTFLWDVQAYLDTLRAIQSWQAPLFVPAHAPAVTDIAPLAQANISKVEEIAALLLELCSAPATFETILQRLFTRLELHMDFQQHDLVGCSVRSYLTWLQGRGLVEACFADNLLLWKKV